MFARAFFFPETDEKADEHASWVAHQSNKLQSCEKVVWVPTCLFAQRYVDLCIVKILAHGPGSQKN